MTAAPACLVSRGGHRRASRAHEDHRQRRRTALHQRRHRRTGDPPARRTGRLPLVGAADGGALAVLPRHLVQPPLQLPQPESANGDQSFRARRSRGSRGAHQGAAPQTRESRRHVDGRGDGADAGDRASEHGSQSGAGRATPPRRGRNISRMGRCTRISCSRIQDPARDAFAAGNDEAAMRFFVDGFATPGRFDKLAPEARLGVMQNAGFFRMMTRSQDPYPDICREVSCVVCECPCS